VLGLNLLEPVGQLGVVQELDFADDGGVEIDEDLHGGDQEGGGAASGIQQAQGWENLEQEGVAEGGVEV